MKMFVFYFKFSLNMEGAEPKSSRPGEEMETWVLDEWSSTNGRSLKTVVYDCNLIKTQWEF